jgi:hypothetical protein
MTQARSDSDMPNTTVAIRLAALEQRDPDTGATSVPCGADGICNAAACSRDPDCPGGVGRPAPEDSGLPQSSTEVRDCTAGEATEMREAVAWGAANWRGFESAMESFDGWPVNIKNCLENRFRGDGKVVCEQSSKGMCDGNNAWASPFNRKCHLCPSFVSKVKGLSGDANKDNRAACYFAILTHEWAHTCERTHKTVEIIDNVAFDFYKAAHPNVTIGISGCGMD